MSADWQSVRTLFEQVVELSVEQRRTTLDRETKDRPELRAAVERLLAAEDAQAADATTGSFLEPPTLMQVLAPSTPPARVGPFRLLEPIGRGGMGSVWLAEQEHPQRRVAVKVMHGSFAGGRHAERFRAEIDVLARLQHPGVAQVYEAGVEPDGTAWFAMELVEGAAPITHALAEPHDARAIARAFLPVCDAVSHAHQRGVIHRDLKPANILCQPDGSVKVIDFGIALQLDADAVDRTREGEMLGTLAYMSPEQVEGGATDVRTDIYGLGAVLYQLLAGRRPFDFEGVSITTACRTIVERDPTPLGDVAPGTPRELQWIVQMAMRKEPSERYGSVVELMADLRAFLRHEPVRAAPPSLTYVLRKFARRHRLAIATAATVFVVSVGAFVTTAVALMRTQQAEASERARRTEAEDASHRAEAALGFLLQVFESVRPDRGSRDIKLVDALTNAAKTFDQELAASPTVRAELGRAIGVAYLRLGDLDEAHRRQLDTLEVHRSCYGRDDRRTAQVEIDLSQVEMARGRLEDAEAHLAEAERVLADTPAHDLLRISAAVRRGDLQRARGDKAGAVVTLRPVVDWLRENRPEARETLLVMNLLAGVLHEQGDLDGAEPLYRAAIDGFHARGEVRNPDMLSASGNYLMLLNSRGRRAEMVPLLEQLVASCREVLGEHHPETIGTLSNLGGVHYMLGDFAKARDTFREALAAFPPATDDRDRVLQTVLANLAKLELELGDHADALQHGERVLASRRAVYGDDHELTLLTAILVGDVLHRSGEIDTALDRLRDAERRAAAANPPQAVNRFRALTAIAECQIEKRDFAAAETALRTADALFDKAEAQHANKQTLPPIAPLFRKLYKAWGRPDEAAKYDADDAGR